MAPAGQDRERLRQALVAAVGQEAADQLMESLPPFPWHQVARQGDLLALRADVENLRHGVDNLRQNVDNLGQDIGELHTEFRVLQQSIELRFQAQTDALSSLFHAELLTHARTMWLSMLAAVFTAASLAFAAVRL